MPGNPFAEELARRQGGNPFRAELERRNAAPSGNAIGREFASRRAVDNLLAAPSVLANLFVDTTNLAGAGIQHGVANGLGFDGWRRLFGGTPKNPGPTFGERYEKIKANESFGQHLLRNIPRPTVEDITATFKSIPSLLPGGEKPSDAMARNRLEFQRDELDMRDAHPNWARGGEIAGDVLSIVGARRVSGIDDIVRRVETRLGRGLGLNTAEGVAADINKRMAPVLASLSRAGVRAAETGVEAAALDILKDPNADPLDTAAIAAGGQLVGSGALGVAHGLMSGGPMSIGLKLSLAAITATGLIQTFKSVSPGDRDRILESTESGFNKVAAMLAVGIGAATIGATRYNRASPGLTDQSRALLNNISTVHRGAALSVLSDWSKGTTEDRAAIEKALAAMSEDPYYRGETEKEREIVVRIRSGAGLVRQETGGGF